MAEYKTKLENKYKEISKKIEKSPHQIELYIERVLLRASVFYSHQLGMFYYLSIERKTFIATLYERKKLVEELKILLKFDPNNKFLQSWLLLEKYELTDIPKDSSTNVDYKNFNNINIPEDQSIKTIISSIKEKYKLIKKACELSPPELYFDINYKKEKEIPTLKELIDKKLNRIKEEHQKVLDLENLSNKVINSPQNPKLYYQRADGLMKLGYFKHAIKDLNKSIQIDPSEGNYYYRKGVLIFSKKIKHYITYKNESAREEVIDNFTKAIELDPKHTKAIKKLADFYFVTEDYQKALDNYSKILSKKDNDYKFYHKRAVCYFNTKEYSKSIELYNKYLEYIENCENPKAINSKQVSNYFDSFYHKGIALLREKRIQKSLEVFDEIINNEDFNKQDKEYIVNNSYIYKSISYYKQGKENLAISILDKINKKNINANSPLIEFLILVDLNTFFRILVKLALSDKAYNRPKEIDFIWEINARQIKKTLSMLVDKGFVETIKYLRYNYDPYARIGKSVFKEITDNIFRSKEKESQKYNGLNRFELKIKINIANHMLKFIDLTEKNSLDYKGLHKMIVALNSKYLTLGQQVKEQEKKDVKERMIQQFTHSLSNTLFPNTIYQVSERLKKHMEFKKDAKILNDAYHSEKLVKQQGHILQARNTGNEKYFQKEVRKDRRTLDSSENTVEIEDILNNSLARLVASKFLNPDYRKIDSIREQIFEKQNTNLDNLNNSYEEKVFFNEELTPIEWVNENIANIKVKYSKEWKQIRLKKDGSAEALLQGYFSELFFNSLKYGDHTNGGWVNIKFYSDNTSKYLISKWANKTKPNVKSMSSGVGLDSIKNDLEMLNESKSENRTLMINKNYNYFIVKIFFRSDLFLLSDRKPDLTQLL